MAHTAVRSRDARVLCCFADQGLARPYETALAHEGVSLLRARDGMHAYYLATSSRPCLAIVDHRDGNPKTDSLLTRIQSDESLVDMRVFVLTDEESLPSLSGQFVAISSHVSPADVASRVERMIEQLGGLSASSVDDVFSAWGESHNVDEETTDLFLRTDSPSEKTTDGPRGESIRHGNRDASRSQRPRMRSK